MSKFTFAKISAPAVAMDLDAKFWLKSSTECLRAHGFNYSDVSDSAEDVDFDELYEKNKPLFMADPKSLIDSVVSLSKGARKRLRKRLQKEQQLTRSCQNDNAVMAADICALKCMVDGVRNGDYYRFEGEDSARFSSFRAKYLQEAFEVAEKCQIVDTDKLKPLSNGVVSHTKFRNGVVWHQLSIGSLSKPLSNGVVYENKQVSIGTQTELADVSETKQLSNGVEIKPLSNGVEKCTPNWFDIIVSDLHNSSYIFEDPFCHGMIDNFLVVFVVYLIYSLFTQMLTWLSSNFFYIVLLVCIKIINNRNFDVEL